MKFIDNAFGVKIIETITDGLYDGNLNCLREYVQNSIDSRAKNIEIYFENGRKDLIIKDDGMGMDQKELENSLKIGISRKSGEDVGWRGIGIWSGSPVSEHIVIITKKKSGKKLRIEIDTDRLRRSVGSNRPALDVLSEITGDIEELSLGKDEIDKNYTMIRLESVLPTQQAIFRDEAIQSYLERVVPAPFDCKDFKLASKVNSWLKQKNVYIPDVRVLFEEEEICRPPNREDIFFNKPIYKEFKVKNKTIAFGWFLCSKNNRKLGEPNNGIYFKKKGFTIGDKDLVINQYDGTYNQWQYGEIHIVSDKLKENAPRNNFEYNNDFVEDFLKEAGKFVGQLSTLNRYQSDRVISNRIEKVKKAIKKGDIQKAKHELKKAKDSLQRPQNFPKDTSLTHMKQVIDNKSQQDKQELTKLEPQIKKTKPTDILQEKRERFNILTEFSPEPIRKHLEKLSAKGKLELELNAMQEIINVLKEKTGSKLNEVHQLSKIAYGWKDVTPSDDRAILTLTEEGRKYRDRCFGVMIHAMHDLFVNAAKHEKGKESFNWFENCSEEEKYEIIAEMYAVIGLIYRLIEKSEICQPSSGSS